MTRVWWVRHGPTHAKAMIGRTDLPADLSDHAAIARLDAALPRPAILISSPLIRAVATADALGSGRDRQPDQLDIAEFDFGDWDGLAWEEIAARDPDLSRRYWESPGDIAAPNGESWNRAASRVTAATDALVRTHSGQDVILVAHYGVILTQVQRALGLSPAEALAQSIDPLSVTRIICDGESWRLDLVNHRP